MFRSERTDNGFFRRRREKKEISFTLQRKQNQKIMRTENPRLKKRNRESANVKCRRTLFFAVFLFVCHFWKFVVFFPCLFLSSFSRVVNVSVDVCVCVCVLVCLPIIVLLAMAMTRCVSESLSLIAVFIVIVVVFVVVVLFKRRIKTQTTENMAREKSK